MPKYAWHFNAHILNGVLNTTELSIDLTDTVCTGCFDVHTSRVV
jgi:hypothetical protein